MNWRFGYALRPVACRERCATRIERSFIEDVLREGSQNIQRCRRHLPPSCACWSSQRAILWEAGRNGEKTPEGWASIKLFEILEDLELASRPEAGTAEAR